VDVYQLGDISILGYIFALVHIDAVLKSVPKSSLVRRST